MVVSTRIVWENITNRFLVFDVPVDVSLADLADEITNSNDRSILMICLLKCKLAQPTIMLLMQSHVSNVLKHSKSIPQIF